MFESRFPQAKAISAVLDTLAGACPTRPSTRFSLRMLRSYTVFYIYMEHNFARNSDYDARYGCAPSLPSLNQQDNDKQIKKIFPAIPGHFPKVLSQAI